MNRVADMSDLPRRRDAGDGWAPDADPRFGTVLVDAWHAARQDVPVARAEARFRHSDAGKCSRAIAYAALGVERSDPIDPPGVFITTQGSIIHEAWQAALRERYADAVEVEVVVGEGETAGHIDAVVREERTPDAERGSRLWAPEPGHPPYVTAIEAKTLGGYAYKRALGVPPAAQRPVGPSREHVLQGALNALAAEADELVIVYFSREAISKQMADRVGDPYQRVAAEWTLARDEFEPLARAELDRVNKILALVDEGTLPARKIPDPELPPRHLIVNAARGEWMSYDAQGVLEDKGVTWWCNYCAYQTRCAATPGQRTPLSQVADVLGLEAQ